tara:strand:- start:184 stop:900 length:717 start_codon:yes stop_codon:yes gene_type:complete
MSFRIIPRLEVKSRNLIKGKKMEGLKKVGSPIDFIKKYYEDGADEILICDIVASLYNRDFNFDFLKEVSENIFLPLNVGGGLRDLENVSKAFVNGADKVVLNSCLFDSLDILKKIASIYGSQSLVAETQIIRNNEKYELRYESGRNKADIEYFEWIKILEKNMVGEILIVSIDNDGIESSNIDFSFLKKVRDTVDISLVYGGGINNKSQIDMLKNIGFQGASISRLLHLNEKKISELL